MIKITCDMCGEELKRHTETVNLYMETDDVITIGARDLNLIKKQLCVTCATCLVNWVEHQLSKGGEADA